MVKYCEVFVKKVLSGNLNIMVWLCMYTHVCVEEEDMEGSDRTQRGKNPQLYKWRFFPTLFISLMLNSIEQDRRGVDSNFSQHLPQVGINALY